MRFQVDMRLLNIFRNAPTPRHLTELWYPCHWFIKRAWRKMETIRLYFMDMVPMDSASIQASTQTASVYWIVGLSSLLGTFAAAQKWDAPGMKMEKCSIREIHLPTLLPVQNISSQKNSLARKSLPSWAVQRVDCWLARV